MFDENKSIEMACNTLRNSFYNDIILPYRNSEVKYVDLHTHSDASDGELSVASLIRHALINNIGVLAITDHDNLNGVKKIPEYGDTINESGIKVINGIELTAKVPVGRMHILGLGIDPNNEYLNSKMYELKSNSINSVISIIDVLKRDYNIRFDYDELITLFNLPHNLGRPDIAKLMVKKGIVSSVKEAFDKYLVDAYNKCRGNYKGISYEECINLIKNSGGLAVLAHPNSLELNEKDFLICLRNLIACGLDGIEVYHSSYSKDEIEYYKKVASEFNLLESCGSDFHGKGVKPDVYIGSGVDNNLNVTDINILKKLLK